MSEQVNDVTPKKKRRTKAEMEAARAAGEAPAKRSTKKNTESTQEPKKPLKPEESVLIMACLEPEVSKKAIEAAKERGVEVVVLEDRVITDYLTSKTEDTNREAVGQFLENTSNRLRTERNLVALYAILTGGAKIEDADKYVFTRTMITRKTKLSHRQAADVLMTLKIFGMLEFTKGDFEFKLIFSRNAQRETIKTEIVSMCKAMNGDILRYKKAVETDDSLTKEQKEEMLKKLQDAINETIEY